MSIPFSEKCLDLQRFLVRETFGTQSTLFIMFSFSDTESGLLFMPVLDVAMFQEVFYNINKEVQWQS
jgi:hypothetical protein